MKDPDFRGGSPSCDPRLVATIGVLAFWTAYAAMSFLLVACNLDTFRELPGAGAGLILASFLVAIVGVFVLILACSADWRR